MNPLLFVCSLALITFAVVSWRNGAKESCNPFPASRVIALGAGAVGLVLLVFTAVSVFREVCK